MTTIRQSKLESFTEIVVSVGIGFFVALITQITVFPLFDIHVNMIEHIEITLIFMVVSVIRGYLVRRIFDLWHYRKYVREKHVDY